MTKYALISPCRNEARYLRQSIESVLRQTVVPTIWIIVDDGSTDATPEILREYAAKHSWIRVVAREDRGKRSVGPGVIDTFNYGLSQIALDDYEYVCKLDLDLDLPPGYFAELIDRMEGQVRLGSCSGKPYARRRNGELMSERCGDEMSVGMTKFYRVSCFRDIGGFVPEVMWDAIDCYKSRQLGWIARSWDDPGLRFEHLRSMGSSQKGILTGRMRHGYGQYFMGSDFFYFTATCVYRLTYPPYVVGGLAMWWGYVRAMASGAPRYDDPDLRRFIQVYQRRALIVGKRRAVAELEGRNRSDRQREKAN
jgi:glycosyltransferase involved in cell wall biosynthesis